MRAACWTVLTSGVLIAAFSAFGSAGAAESATKAANAGLLSESRAPLLLDVAPTVARSQPPAADASQKERVPLIAPWPANTQVSLEVLVEGRPLRTVPYQGKTYLPVPRLGAEYEIRVWNHGPRRIVAVVSVDGLSVINGEPASEAHPGYIVAPYSHILIKGWRRSMELVAAFRFVQRDKSYAGLVGKPENIGVIGLVAVEELVWQAGPALEKKDSTAPAARWAVGQVGSVGTEYGREVGSQVYYVPFVRSANRRTVTLYYDTVEALREVGVPVDSPLPAPFAGAPKFVPPPPGYKGK